CSTCHQHLTPSSSIISRGFQGRHGRAFLLSSSSLPPSAVTLGEPQQRLLVTGMHTVRDFACGVCGTALGWRYEAAEEREQAYKIGKWILEGERVI
ncbi:Yippee/Mis18, partial [Geopyxis carbonaria]